MLELTLTESWINTYWLYVDYHVADKKENVLLVAHKNIMEDVYINVRISHYTMRL